MRPDTGSIVLNTVWTILDARFDLGLSLVVGVLVEQQNLGEEESVLHRQQGFEKVNRLLRANQLPDHHEPLDLGEADPVSFDMYGYSGLHYLRRIASHLWSGGGLPLPGGPDAAHDPLSKRYYALMEQTKTKSSPRLSMMGSGFNHLMFHSDAEGFYVPVRFDDVLFDVYGIGVEGEILGSSLSLLTECEELAKALELPLELDPEAEEVWEATEHQGSGDTCWERYGIESFTCLRLHYAARASVDCGAAIVFC